MYKVPQLGPCLIFRVAWSKLSLKLLLELIPSGDQARPFLDLGMPPPPPYQRHVLQVEGGIADLRSIFHDAGCHKVLLHAPKEVVHFLGLGTSVLCEEGLEINEYDMVLMPFPSNALMTTISWFIIKKLLASFS